jgi:hypothetical protein
MVVGGHNCDQREDFPQRSKAKMENSEIREEMQNLSFKMQQEEKVR